MLRFLLAALILFLSPVRLAANGLDYLQSARADAYFKIESETLERNFHIFVRLPDGYEESDDSYPVIYLLDGGTNYPLLTPYYLLLSFDEPMPEAIIVGISYGGARFEEGNYRSTDYTAPSPEREFLGGAENYQAFLETELLPHIDGEYRTNPARRILFGQSLAGQFVIFSALTKPDLFWGRIASNPAFHRNIDYFLALEPIAPTNNAHVFIASASKDDPQFLAPLGSLLSHWDDNPPPWTLAVETLEGERHASAAPLAFRAGMRWLFPEDCKK